MKKIIRIATVAFLASASLLLSATPAQAHVDWSVNIGVPGPVYYPPAPVYYEPPPAVIYEAPRPVYVQPRPIYVEPQPYYESRDYRYRNYWRDRKWREAHDGYREREWRDGRDRD